MCRWAVWCAGLYRVGRKEEAKESGAAQSIVSTERHLDGSREQVGHRVWA